MCRAKYEGGRRCLNRTHYHVNRESHDRFVPDEEQERHFMKPEPLLSMTEGAINVRRCRARKKAAEVTAMRTIHGLADSAPIGPVIREELWSHRYQGAGLSTVMLADRFRAMAAHEGVPVEEIADRHSKQNVRPHRQRAGERLATLVMTEADRPDWVDPDYLVSMVSPAENGESAPSYLRIVKDLDDDEFVLVTSYDGSEPMAWKNDPAGLKAGAREALDRLQASKVDDRFHEYEKDNRDSAPVGPWTQTMTDNDFLASSAGMHLV